MPHILLTGAGFSRNWGGWLASEAFEYLLGSSHINSRLRVKLWEYRERKLGFEDVLADLQGALASRFDPQSQEDLRNITSAISAMFAEMAAGYDRIDFEPQNEVARMVKTFLSRFDAIYTLNQDTLIEQKYIPGLSGSRFSGCTPPGIKRANSILAVGRNSFNLYTPDDPANFRLSSGIQPYIKLHGSFNWVYDGSYSLLILGGNKEANIRKYPLLSWYHSQFREDLRKPNARLMIIGYSFNDRHINKVILDAEKETNLQLFIIDALGVDVLDKRDPKASITMPPMDLLARLSPRVIGASRRPLTSTFNTDVVEHAKIMKFFN